MTFSIGHKVTSKRVRDRVRRMIVLKRMHRQEPVQHSPNLRLWIDEEDLQPVAASRTATVPENCRRWSVGRNLTKQEIDRRTEITEARELMTSTQTLPPKFLQLIHVSPPERW